jgi:uncharacterized membrane protein YczE
MKTKRVFYTELAYAIGIIVLALGTALMERADFGMSMVVAPAYLLHLKVSEFLPWYSFGVSEYVLQAVLLAVLSLMMRKFKKGYLFSFITAILYGSLLDLSISAVARIDLHGTVFRIACYFLGMLFCAAGVALLFHTYIAPEAYELFVKELAAKCGKDIGRVKTIYDCVSCLIGIALSFVFFGFGRFEGVKLGTVICALVNGTLVGWCSKWLEAAFCFRDRLKLRKFFET